MKPKLEIIRKDVGTYCWKCDGHGVMGNGTTCTLCKGTGEFVEFHYMMIAGKIAFDGDTIK